MTGSEAPRGLQPHVLRALLACTVASRIQHAARAWASLPAVLSALACLLCGQSALAHDTRPAYLDISATPDGTVTALWVVPARAGLYAELEPVLSPDCEWQTTRELQRSTSLTIERSARCPPGPWAGRTIFVEGLDRTLVDVVVRLAAPDVQATHVLRAAAPRWTIPGEPSRSIGSFLRMGVEHIAGGVDHLLFLAGLLLMMHNLRQVITTVTAFTVAHSLTLSASALGLTHVPAAPVEATIALSIVFVARELLVREQPAVTRRLWLTAFGFGLLHGFGFAGALTELELPKDAVSTALIGFNLGVEIGQLGFVLVLALAARLIGRDVQRRMRPAAAYGIGSVAVFWFVERVSAF